MYETDSVCDENSCEKDDPFDPAPDPVKEYDIASQLNVAQEAILDLKQTLDEKTSVLQKERAIFEEMRKTLDKVHFTKHIKLNVGGQVFKTSIETLVKDPGSMLAAMFSQRFDVKLDEEDGAYFIDKDGTHFRYTCMLVLIRGRSLLMQGGGALEINIFLDPQKVENIFYQTSNIN
jgi:hypothetical protein